jgi:hypothetical protein
MKRLLLPLNRHRGKIIQASDFPVKTFAVVIIF